MHICGLPVGKMHVPLSITWCVQREWRLTPSESGLTLTKERLLFDGNSTGRLEQSIIHVTGLRQVGFQPAMQSHGCQHSPRLSVYGLWSQCL